MVGTAAVLSQIWLNHIGGRKGMKTRHQTDDGQVLLFKTIVLICAIDDSKTHEVNKTLFKNTRQRDWQCGFASVLKFRFKQRVS